jgi:hypothetical protein
MMKFFVRVFAALAIANGQSALAANVLSQIFGGRGETIQIQTLTLSDEQFLKGDPSGKPTTIFMELCGSLKALGAFRW